ncbi:relaxase/mobilization nuclease domain-containing protein [Acidicapsa acidisoli]|uniref:relaxase/mobilization nuclease domain-containing protein n=1 Tax=Acidicapsa acidisoli TaxID=1615681 RepID=UPI0021E0F166|nr:relaxase/mobilization nuclease domain-containing protein [Acidicapsa acidisoli]
MIIKGGSRAGPEQLAKHLQRRDTNEMVDILELQSPAPNLDEALRDWQTLSEGTRGQKGLYHVNIDPAEGYVMSLEQWERCVEVLETELGFEGQPRAVVMHQKHSRQHLHVVWARTDIDTMTLRSDSMNYPAHERASKAMELEFGHEPVPGKHAKRDREKQPEFPNAAVNHAEWQQAQRTGINPAERKDQITALKQASDSPQAFMRALEEQGYILAKGERRDFVLVDAAGEIYSLARQIHGMKAAELRAYMKGLDPEILPTAEQAAQLQQQMQDQRKQVAEKQVEPAPPESDQPEPAQPAEQTKGLSPEEIQAIQKAVADRQAREARDMRQRQENEYNHTRDVLDAEMAESIGHFEARQEAERARFARENAPVAGVDRAIDRFQRRWNPELVQERDAERERRQQEMENRLTKEHADYAAQLKQTRDLDLENLAERHAQQLRDHAQQTAEDLARYIREQETARRLRAEIKERTMDGPEWPPPLTR